MIKYWFFYMSGIGLSLIGFASTAQAQFMGASVDLIIAYTGANGPANGYTVGITHPVPFMPNFGLLSLNFTDNSDPIELNNQSIYYNAGGGNTYSLNTTIDITSFEFFYHIPMPVVSFTAGVGGGVMAVNTEILRGSEILETVNLSSNIAELFIRVGLPMWHLLDFHVGLHGIAANPIDVVKGNNTPAISVIDTKRDYSGTAATIGLQLAF